MYHVTHHPKLLVLKRSKHGVVTALVGNRNDVRNYRQGVPYSAGGMAFGPDGALYFTHGANVSKVSTSGRLTALARNIRLENASGDRAGETQLFGIAVDGQGNAFVADHGNRRIIKIAPDNQTPTLIRAEGSWFPTGVAEKDGELFILEESHTASHTPTGTRVRKRSREGTATVLAIVGENNISSGTHTVRDASSDEDSEAADETKRNTRYVLIGAGIGVFVLTAIAWRIRSRVHQPSP